MSNCKGPYNQTPLTHAAMYREPEVTQLLLEKGADVNCKSAKGHTPLWFAIRHGKPELVQVLLENGANVNFRDWGGRTVTVLPSDLYNKSKGEKQMIVRLLVERNADTTVQDKNGITPLGIALDLKESEMAEILRSIASERAQELQHPLPLTPIPSITAPGLGSEWVN